MILCLALVIHKSCAETLILIINIKSSYANTSIQFHLNGPIVFLSMLDKVEKDKVSFIEESHIIFAILEIVNDVSFYLLLLFPLPY